MKFSNRKDAENILTNKKKFRDIDFSKIVTDDTEIRSDQSLEVQNEWKNVVSNPTKRKKCLYPRISVHITGTFTV